MHWPEILTISGHFRSEKRRINWADYSNVLAIYVHRYTSKGSSMELTCDLLIIANSAKHYLNKPLKAKLPELDPGLNTYLLHAIDTLTVVACQQAAEST